MFELFLTTGIVLLLVGVVASSYLFYALKKWGRNTDLMLFLSDSTAIVLIGTFYIASFALANKSLLFVGNNNGQRYPNVSYSGNGINVTEPEISGAGEAEEVFFLVLSTTTNTNSAEGDYYEMTTETLPPAYDDDALNTTNIANASVLSVEEQQKLNATLALWKRYQEKFLNVTNVATTAKRNKRQSAGAETEPDKCETETKMQFLQDAMLVYSFVQSFVSLIANSNGCKKQMKKCTESGENDCEQDEEQEIQETKSKELKPSGSLFKESVEEVFTVKSAAGAKPASVRTKKGFRNKRENKNFYPTVALSWALPLLGVLILYLTMPTGDKCRSDHQSALANSTQTSTEAFLKEGTKTLEQKPMIVTNSKKVNDIVNSVYTIVSNFRQPKRRSQQQEPDRDSSDSPRKLYVFLLLVAGFLAANFYGYLVNVRMTDGLGAQVSDEVASELQKILQRLKTYLVTFLLAWCPAVLEKTVALFVKFETDPMLNEALVTLGNFFLVMVNSGNLFFAKNMNKQKNSVMPN